MERMWLGKNFEAIKKSNNTSSCNEEGALRMRSKVTDKYL